MAHKHINHIIFHDRFRIRDNKLHFCYTLMYDKEPGKFFNDEDVEEPVPPAIVSQGDEAIKEYANKRIAEMMKPEMDRRERARKKREALQHPISIVIDGIHVHGRIIDGTEPRELFQVILDTPEKDTARDRFFGCMALSMSGFKAWTAEGDITESAIERARGELAKLYRTYTQRNRNPKLASTLDRLNKK